MVMGTAQLRFQEDPMRKLTATLSAAAVITVGAVVGLQGGAQASPARTPGPHGVASAVPAASQPDISFTTTMTSYTPVTVAPGGLKPGDGYVLSGRVHLHGKAVGLSTASCVYTTVKSPELRICSVDYTIGTALIATTGFIDSTNPGAAVTLVVEGGTGAFANDRGYGLLTPTNAGSHVTLYLAK
jgi:hypothetical protein